MLSFKNVKVPFNYVLLWRTELGIANITETEGNFLKIYSLTFIFI